MSRPIPHGTLGSYVNRKCRCVLCRRANALYNAGVREKRFVQGVCCECSQPALNGLRCDEHAKRLNEGRHKCECGHRSRAHRPGCIRCACATFTQCRTKVKSNRVSLRHPMTAEAKNLAHVQRIERARNRWRQRYPGIDPAIAETVYREGYQAGHQCARMDKRKGAA